MLRSYNIVGKTEQDVRRVIRQIDFYSDCETSFDKGDLGKQSFRRGSSIRYSPRSYRNSLRLISLVRIGQGHPPAYLRNILVSCCHSIPEIRDDRRGLAETGGGLAPREVDADPMTRATDMAETNKDNEVLAQQ